MIFPIGYSRFTQKLEMSRARKKRAGDVEKKRVGDVQKNRREMLKMRAGDVENEGGRCRVSDLS